MRPYDLKYLMQTLVAIAIMLVACMASKGAAIALAIPFVLLALLANKPEKLFFWMMFLMASIVFNGYFMPRGPAYGVIHRGLLALVGLISVVCFAGKKKNAILASLLWMMAYIAYMIIPSSFGWWPMVSYLKIVLFSLVFIALIGMSNTIATNQRVDGRRIRSVFLAFCIVFVFGSMALIPFPAIGQLTGEEYEMALRSGSTPTSLFKGMTNQSQALGPIISMIGVLLVADLIFGVRKLDRLYVFLLLCVPYLIYSTSSRTAMGAFVLAIGFLLFCFVRVRGISLPWRRKVVGTAVTSAVLLVGVALCSSEIRDGIARYVLKYDANAKASDLNWEDATKTRQGLMDVALDDFRKKPLVGNGFQVDERLVYTMGDTKGMILSAPVEKGVWITAILQEGGLLGFGIYGMFLIGVAIRMSKRRYYLGLILFVVLHLLNLGEFTLFSLSGMGGFLWALVLIGIILDEARLREHRVIPLVMGGR